MKEWIRRHTAGPLTALTAVVLTAAIFTAPAYAGGSCYIGASAGYSIANSDTSLDLAADALGSGSPAVPGLVSIDGLGADGGSGGFLGGCDWRTDRVLFGAWADYTWHGAEWSGGVSLNPALPLTAGADLSLDRQWSVGGRAGYFVTDSTLLYGLIGYTRVSTSDIGWNANFAGSTISGALAVEDLDGIVYGGGLEVDVGSGIIIGAEYRYTDLDEANVAVLPGALNLNLDTDIHTARAVIKYRFGLSQ